MKKSAWQLRTFALSWLRGQAEDCPQEPSFQWLKRLGVVPLDLVSMPVSQVLSDIHEDKFTAGYLASAAFEWDSWGASKPIDFVKALELEVNGNTQRDSIRELLTSLGTADASSEPCDEYYFIPLSNGQRRYDY